MKKLILAAFAALAFAAAPARAALFGSGTEDDPYFVSSVADWTEFADNVAAGIGTNAFYKLGTHVLGATNCVGTAEHPFAGTFDGNGFTLRVELGDTQNQGTAPFRHVECATITNLTVTGTVVGTTHAAGLVGFAHGAWQSDGHVWLSRVTTVADCTVLASVSNPATSGDRHLGVVVSHALSSHVVIRDTVFAGTSAQHPATAASRKLFGMENETEKCYNIHRFEAIARLRNGKESNLKKTGELDIRGTVVRVVKIDGEDCMRSVVQLWRIRHNWLMNEGMA